MIHVAQIAVFGASGFIGRPLVQRIARTGALIRVPTRDLEKSLILKPMGDPGHIAPVFCSLRSDSSVAQAIGKAETVVNLIGTLHGKGHNGFQDVHVDGAARIARLARESGVKRLIHMSSLAADAQSSSAYARSKAAGEEAVRAYFPDAAIFRPSLVVGPEDKFFRMFSRMAKLSPFLPLIGGGETQFQPVCVGDVAEAMFRVLNASETGSGAQTYALGGPQIYSFRQMMTLMLEAMGIRRRFVSIPWGMAQALGAALEIIPNPPLTRDQVELLKTDNIICPESGLKTLGDLGITPTPIEAVLPACLA